MANRRYMQYVSTIAAAWLASSCYMINSWSSPAIVKLTSENSPIGVTLSTIETSWVASAPMLGFIIGAMSSSWFLIKFGLKKTLIIGALPVILSWIVIACTKSVAVLITMRWITGFGEGFIITTVPLYIGEVSDKDIRGRLTTTITIMTSVGNMLVYSVGPFVSYMALTLLCAAVPLITTTIFVFMPESPYFLCEKGRLEESKNSLKRLIGSNLNENAFTKRFLDIQATVFSNNKTKIGLRDLCRKRNYRRAIILILGLKLSVHLCGLSAIKAHLQKIIELTASSISPQISSIIFGVVQLPFVLLSGFLMDKIGRKTLFVISSTGCAISLICEGVYFYLQESSPELTAHLQWLPTLCLTAYAMFIPIGILSVPHVIAGELLASEVKSGVSSFTTTIGAIASFLSTKYFLPVSIMFGLHTMFFIYAGFCTMICVFVIVVLPETKRKSFLEIQEILKTKSHC